MTKFTIHTYTNKVVVYQEVSVKWSEEVTDQLMSNLATVLSYMQGFSQPLNDLSGSEIAQEYRQLKEKYPEKEKELKSCYSSFRSFLYDDGQIAENFSVVYHIPCKTYDGAPVITTKTNCLIRVPDELRENYNSGSTIQALAVITTEGEFKIFLRVSNDTPESKLHVPLMTMRFNFIKLLKQVHDINPDIAKEEIANMRNSLDKIGESK